MKKIITIIAVIILTSCESKDNDCHNEKALASEYYVEMIRRADNLQVELLEIEMQRYLEVKACDCMFFTNLKRIESKYNQLLSQAETPEEVNQLQLQRQTEIMEVSECAN